MLCLALLLRITPCLDFSFCNLLLHLTLFILYCTLLLLFPPYFSPSPYYFALQIHLALLLHLTLLFHLAMLLPLALLLQLTLLPHTCKVLATLSPP